MKTSTPFRISCLLFTACCAKAFSPIQMASRQQHVNSVAFNNKRALFASTVLEEPRTTEEAVTTSESSATETEEIATTTNMASTTGTEITVEIKDEVNKEMSETQKLMQQVKDAGVAGVVSYALWELGFWTISVPFCVFGYRELTGHWPDFANPEDMQKLGAEAFAFVNFARFAVPLRIGLALGTTPWIQENIIDRFSSSPKTEHKMEEENLTTEKQ